MVQTKSQRPDAISDGGYYMVQPNVRPVLGEVIRIDTPVRRTTNACARNLMYIIPQYNI